MIAKIFKGTYNLFMHGFKKLFDGDAEEKSSCTHTFGKNI